MKLGHEEVDYEHPAKGKNHCGQCEHFIPANHCKIVEDPIRPEDWCKEFEMAKLTTAARKAIPGKSFALSGRRYPIEDASHARNALARVSQHGSSEEKSKVRAAVHRRYPGIGQRKMVPLKSMRHAK